MAFSFGISPSLCAETLCAWKNRLFGTRRLGFQVHSKLDSTHQAIWVAKNNELSHTHTEVSVNSRKKKEKRRRKELSFCETKKLWRCPRIRFLKLTPITHYGFYHANTRRTHERTNTNTHTHARACTHARTHTYTHSNLVFYAQSTSAVISGRRERERDVFRNLS